MGTFFVYILKTSVCLAAFYLFYRLLLSRETFHRFNRIALLGILFLSLVIPFCEITIPKSIEVQQTLLSIEQILTLADNAPRLISQPSVSSIPLWITVLLFTYFSGILFFFARSVYSLLHMIRLLHNGKKEELEGGITLVTHDKNIAPFSWMKYVVISEKDMQENRKEILAHELAHVHRHHSIDLLVSDICICFQWFNPASWLLKQELQNIHEYEADETVIRQGINAKQYQLLLIKKAVGTRLYSMANSFNHSKLKKRITMMLKEKSSPWARVKYLYVLPVAAFTLTAFARPEITNELNEISAIKVNDITSILETKEVNNSHLTVDTTKVSHYREHGAKRVVINLNEMTARSKFYTTQTKVKRESDSTITPKSFITITEAFRVPNDSIGIVGNVTLAFPGLFIVNGKQIPLDSLKTLDSSRIETVSVLRDEHAIKLYGEKAKDGVVIITMSSSNNPEDQIIATKLADGSTVYLSKKSSKSGTYAITVKDTSSIRTVKLTGEASFKVVEADTNAKYILVGDTLRMDTKKKK